VTEVRELQHDLICVADDIGISLLEAAYRRVRGCNGAVEPVDRSGDRARRGRIVMRRRPAGRTSAMPRSGVFRLADVLPMVPSAP